MNGNSMRKNSLVGNWSGKAGSGDRNKELWTLAAVLLLVLGFLAFHHYPDSGDAGSIGDTVVRLLEKLGSPTITGANIAISNAGSATTCGGVNASITLTQDVISVGTCYIVNASNIIIDCAGRNINYSASGVPGLGINITAFNNVTIRHCVINQITNSGPAITIDRNTSNASVHITIYNTTIYVPSRNISGNGNANVPAIRIRENSNNTNISHVTIRTTADNATGILFIDSHHHIVEFTNVTVNGSNARGIWLWNSRNNTIRAVDIRTWNTSAVYIVGDESRDNIIYNSSLIVNMLSSTEVFVLEDMTPGTLNNSLQFDGRFGYINWTKGNISTRLNLSIGETIFIGNNTVGVLDAGNLNSRINETARIALRGLAAHLGNPQLFRGSTRCDNTDFCNTTFDATDSVLMANVSFFSNYSAGRGCGLVTENISIGQSVSTDGTCFTIGANNVELNCTGGVTINYSSGGSYGMGINISGYSNTIIRNCAIFEGSSTTNAKHAINISGASINTRMINITINLTGVGSVGIILEGRANFTNITDSRIEVWGDGGGGFRIINSSGNFVTETDIILNRSGAVALHLQGASNNTFTALDLLGRMNNTLIYFADDEVADNYWWNTTTRTFGNFTLLDLSNNTNFNQLIYNNTGGMINWTLANLTTEMNLRVEPWSDDTDGARTMYFVIGGSPDRAGVDSDNLIGVLDSPLMRELNNTATIVFYQGLYASNMLLRQGTQCDTTVFCNITSQSAARVEARVSHFSNYTVIEAPGPGSSTSIDSGGHAAAAAAEAAAEYVAEYGEEAVQEQLEQMGYTPEEAAALIADALVVSVESVSVGEALTGELTAEERSALEALIRSLSPEERAQLGTLATLTGEEAAQAARELLRERRPGQVSTVETRQLVFSESVSVSLQNKGKEEIALEAALSLEEIAPVLVNEGRVREIIREELISKFSREGKEYTEKELEREVEQTVLTLRIMEDQEVRFLLKKVFTLSPAARSSTTPEEISQEGTLVRAVHAALKNTVALTEEIITLVNELLSKESKAGVTGGAVTSLSDGLKTEDGGPETRDQIPPTEDRKLKTEVHSASGIAPTGKRIAGRLLLPLILEEKDFVIKPGESIQQQVKLFRGLSTTPREVTLSLTTADGEAAGLEVNRQKVQSASGVIYGGAVDVHREENVMDIYLLLPPGETEANYMLEVRLLLKESSKINEIPLKMGFGRLSQLFSSPKHVLYAELYGPYRVPAGREEGIMLAQQFAYDENIYDKAYLLQMRLWRGSTLVANQLYPVVLG